MMTLYSMPSSGNSYKVRLLLAQLGITYKHVATEYDGGQELTKTDDFRALNPAGKVPLVELEDGRHIAESNAILTYFAQGTRFLPEDRYEQAKVFQWMFFEQNAHETSVAVHGAIHRYPERAHLKTPEVLDPLFESGNRVLDVMEAQLLNTPYLAGDTYTIADIALYGYTHSAPDSGFDIKGRTGISAWLQRVKQQPGHVALDWLPA